MNIRFQYSDLSWLWLVMAGMAILYAGYLYWKKNVRRRMGNEKLVRIITRGHSPRRSFLKMVLVFLAITAGIIAALNPVKPGAGNTVQRRGIDIAIALDVSKSMLATDLMPNRLERARQLVSKLMDELPDDRIALVLFAGKAYMQMPLTTDHGAARLFVASASTDAVSQQGTVISEALRMSARVFNSVEKRYKSILLISDGEDHDGEAIRTAGELADQGIMINTVGIGSAEGSVIIDPATGVSKLDASGNTVISKLNEQTLRGVADKTNGTYIRLQGSDEAVTAIKNQLSQIERKSFGDISLMNFRTFYMWLAAAMFGLLLAEPFIPERKKRDA